MQGRSLVFMILQCHLGTLEAESPGVLGEDPHPRVGSRNLLSRMVCCKASVFSLLFALSSLPARGGINPSVLPHPYQNLLAGNPLEKSFALNCKFREGILPSASQGCRVFNRQQIPNGCISGVSSNIRCDASGLEITGNPTHADFSLKKYIYQKMLLADVIEKS